MAQYLVPCSGFLVIEAASSQQAEIMALTWGQSLLRRKTDSCSIQNTKILEASQNNIRETTTAEVKAVSVKFAQNRITDITLEIESHRQQAIEKDQEYRQKHKLRETELSDEQIVLFALGKESGEV